MTRGKATPRPTRIAGFKPGDLVKTPLGRIARITACRTDELLDAKYVGPGSPWSADVILQPHTLEKLDAQGNAIAKAGGTSPQIPPGRPKISGGGGAR
jgi:hypothetical protein